MVSGLLKNGIAVAVFAMTALSGTALAQDDLTGPQTVAWTAEPLALSPKAGPATLILHGSVTPGWHVYSLKQAPDGPTPLLVTVTPGDVVASIGAPAGTPPTRIHDPAFNLETQFYAGNFTLTLPVRVKAHAAGEQVIPVDVRFQTCNGKVCQPPRTVRLNAAITRKA